MIDGRATSALVPPSISDARGKAFGKVMARAVADPDFKKLLFERIDEVDASVLPFLIREFSIEEFVEPGMSETVIRRLLKASYELHATKGFIHGVRRGLLMLGMRVVWKQWFQNAPKTERGTHTATVYVNEAIFDGQGYLLDERVQRAAVRMIAGMKRYSQDVTFQLGVAIAGKMSLASAVQALQIGDFGATASTPRKGRAHLSAAAGAQALQVGQYNGTATTPRRGRSFVSAAVAAQAIQIGRFEANAKHRSMR